MLVLVTYDICITDMGGTGRLRKVAKQCENYGVRVQNSVFECKVDNAQFTLLKHQLLEIMDEKQDSVRFYLLGDKYKSKVEHYGVKYGINVDEPLIL